MTQNLNKLSLARLVETPEWDYLVRHLRVMQADYLAEMKDAVLVKNWEEATKLAAKSEMIDELISKPLELFSNAKEEG